LDLKLSEIRIQTKTEVVVEPGSYERWHTAMGVSLSYRAAEVVPRFEARDWGGRGCGGFSMGDVEEVGGGGWPDDS
jgi:hypothetical protein